MVLLFRDLDAIVCLNLKEKLMLNQLPGFPVTRLLRIRAYILVQGKLALQPKNRSHHPIFL